jgi:hypothetical protein
MESSDVPVPVSKPNRMPLYIGIFVLLICCMSICVFMFLRQKKKNQPMNQPMMNQPMMNQPTMNSYEN